MSNNFYLTSANLYCQISFRYCQQHEHGRCCLFVFSSFLKYLDQQANSLLSHRQCYFSVVHPPGEQPGGGETDGSSDHTVINQ